MVATENVGSVAAVPANAGTPETAIGTMASVIVAQATEAARIAEKARVLAQRAVSELVREVSGSPRPFELLKLRRGHSIATGTDAIVSGAFRFHKQASRQVKSALKLADDANDSKKLAKILDAQFTVKPIFEKKDDGTDATDKDGKPIIAVKRTVQVGKRKPVEVMEVNGATFRNLSQRFPTKTGTDTVPPLSAAAVRSMLRSFGEPSKDYVLENWKRTGTCARYTVKDDGETMTVKLEKWEQLNGVKVDAPEAPEVVKESYGI